MNTKDIKSLEELLYHLDKQYIKIQLENTKDSIFLHWYASNYNWNNGFEVPTMILENPACDFGTALLMFHLVDGYRMLENPDQVSNSSLKDWKEFLSKCYMKLLAFDFESQSISFDPELTNIQKFKLKKNNPNMPNIFINKSPGDLIDVPKI
ncbi:MAG: DUF4274 domain-containing protein [Bacillota bacterium]